MIAAVATLHEAVGYMLLGFVGGAIAGLYFEFKSTNRLKKENERLRRQRREGWKPVSIDWVNWEK